MKSKKEINLLVTLILISVLPLLACGVMLCVIFMSKLSDNLEDGVYNQLKVAAEGLDRYYAREFNEHGEVPYEHDFVDNLLDQGVEQTLFLGDTRYITSIKDRTTKKRNEETKADANIYEHVMQGKDYHADGVIIGGNKYYVYYTPVKDNSGTIIGMAFAGKLEQSVKHQIVGGTTVLLTFTVIMTLIIAAIVIILALKIGKPIASISNSTNILAQGHICCEIKAKSKIREIRVLIDAATTLQKSLKDIISNVNNNLGALDDNMGSVACGVESCNQASNEIVISVDELAQGTLSMSESVAKCNSSMEDISNEITGISELADNANAYAVEVRNVSVEAKNMLNKLIGANEHTIEISRQVVEGIFNASTAAEKIREASNAISNIASQTNLLSLNASIEAARAGEAGRGFAVVATNISELATQSDMSAREIQETIERIIEISDNNVRLATEIKNAIDQEGDVLHHVNQSFDTVNTKISDTADVIFAIDSKAQDLDQQKAVVIDEVNTLYSISQHNAASCQETNASMEEMKASIETIHQQAMETKDVSEGLGSIVSHFKLEA